MRRGYGRRGWRVARRRRVVVERFVGSLVVVHVAEPVELPLLRAEVGGRRTSRVLLQRLVHALVRAVLLRARGVDALLRDAELQPPGVELAQTVDTGRREGSAVVGADGIGQTELTEQALEGWPCPFRPHRVQTPALEQEAAVVVDDRQRVAVHAVARPELPLEVRCPYLVGGRGRERHRARVFPARTTPLRPHQAVALQNVEDGAARRQLEPWVASLQHAPQFARTPAVLAPGRQDQLHHGVRRRVRAARRGAATLAQTCDAVRLEALHPLVASGSRHAVPAAQLAHRPVPARVVDEESYTLPHRVRLHPRHPTTSVGCRCKSCAWTPVNHVPGSNRCPT